MHCPSAAIFSVTVACLYQIFRSVGQTSFTEDLPEFVTNQSAANSTGLPAVYFFSIRCKMEQLGSKI